MTVIYEAYEKFKRHYIDFGNNINTTELFKNSTIMDGGQLMEEVVFGMGRYICRIKTLIREQSSG
jgi:hypothetical protein